MKYSSSLAKKEREQIFKLFLEHNRLKFNDIEKAIKIRSNMIAYHIECMQKDNLLEKRGEYYHLTKDSEKYIPIFSHVVGEELSPLPVVLVAIVRKNKLLMIKRTKRPYKDYVSLIGGKMRLEESFVDTSLRLTKEKTGLDGKFISFNAVMHERVVSDDAVKHSFILFFTKVEVTSEKVVESKHGTLHWFTIKQIEKQKVIHSDRWLIENKFSSKIDVKSAMMQEDEGFLFDFMLDE